jgi:DMSO/TMAO reductase YedYZ molybdopterin-dependent catalytic subunit
MLGLTAAGVVFGAAAQNRLQRLLQPLTLRDPTGLTGLLPVGGGFRIYSVVGFLPHRSTSAYRLTVEGLVDKPLTLGVADLTAMPQTRLVKDFQCVTGWRVPSVPWEGVRLGELLDRAGVQAGATHLALSSFDGSYTESLTLDQARRPDVLVALRLQDQPLSDEHGGPVRLYIAPMYGYKSIKWLDRIEVVHGLQQGYWEGYGYDVDGWIGRSNGRTDEPV